MIYICSRVHKKGSGAEGSREENVRLSRKKRDEKENILKTEQLLYNH